MRNGVLSNNLRQWRKARRLTQTVLAEQAGITRQSIIAIEKGRLNPSVAVALSLAALLNASVEDLFALNPAEALADEGVAAACHFSCVGATRATVREQLAALQAMGIQRLVALRGDLPSGYGMGGEFVYASDLVAFIRAETGDAFHIEVAAYPEIHPQAKSADADLQAFAAKVKAGANSAITQYFFNADAYFRFVDDVQRLGVEVPVVPGIMPILNYGQVARMAELSGAAIPAEVLEYIEPVIDDPAEVRRRGVELATQLCRDVIAAGAPGLHFITLNRSKASREILETLKGEGLL